MRHHFGKQEVRDEEKHEGRSIREDSAFALCLHCVADALGDQRPLGKLKGFVVSFWNVE